MKTETDYKEELLLKLKNDCFDFADRDGKDWDWVELSDFLIRRGWRNNSISDK